VDVGRQGAGKGALGKWKLGKLEIGPGSGVGSEGSSRAMAMGTMHCVGVAINDDE